MKVHSGGYRDESVGDLRRKPARKERVLAILSPTANHVETLLETPHQGRDIGGIVLSIPVQRHYDVATRVVESRRECRGLAKVPPQSNHLNPGIPTVERSQDGVAGVGASVVDE